MLYPLSMLVVVTMQHARQVSHVAQLVTANVISCKHLSPALGDTGQPAGHTLMGRRLALQLQLKSLSCHARLSPSCAIRKGCTLVASACEACGNADKAPAWLHCRPAGPQLLCELCQHSSDRRGCMVMAIGCKDTY